MSQPINLRKMAVPRIARSIYASIPGVKYPANTKPPAGYLTTAEISALTGASQQEVRNCAGKDIAAVLLPTSSINPHLRAWWPPSFVAVVQEKVARRAATSAPDPKLWAPAKEAAALLACARSTLYRLEARGVLPCLKLWVRSPYKRLRSYYFRPALKSLILPIPKNMTINPQKTSYAILCCMDLLRSYQDRFAAGAYLTYTSPDNQINLHTCDYTFAIPLTETPQKQVEEATARIAATLGEPFTVSAPDAPELDDGSWGAFTETPANSALAASVLLSACEHMAACEYPLMLVIHDNLIALNAIICPRQSICEQYSREDAYLLASTEQPISFGAIPLTIEERDALMKAPITSAIPTH